MGGTETGFIITSGHAGHEPAPKVDQSPRLLVPGGSVKLCQRGYLQNDRLTATHNWKRPSGHSGHDLNKIIPREQAVKLPTRCVAPELQLCETCSHMSESFAVEIFHRRGNAATPGRGAPH